MMGERYGKTKVSKIRHAYNELRSAIASGDIEKAQSAFDRYEQWSDYVMTKISDPIVEELKAANRGLVRLNEVTEARALMAEAKLSKVGELLLRAQWLMRKFSLDGGLVSDIQDTITELKGEK